MDYPTAIPISAGIVGIFLTFLRIYNGKKGNPGHNEMRDECKVLFDVINENIKEIKKDVKELLKGSNQ